MEDGRMDHLHGERGSTAARKRLVVAADAILHASQTYLSLFAIPLSKLNAACAS